MSSSSQNDNGKRDIFSTSAILPFTVSQNDSFKSTSALKFASNSTGHLQTLGPVLFGGPSSDFSNSISSPSMPFSKSYQPEHQSFNTNSSAQKYYIQVPTKATEEQFMPLSSQPLNLHSSNSYFVESEIKEDEFEPIKFIESKIPKSSLPSIPDMFNEYSSCSIRNKPDVILVTVRELLVQYSSDIELQIHENEIEGTVFIRHRPIQWVVTIWLISQSNDENVSRVEFQRRSGNTVDFQKFWSDMLEKIHQKFETKNVNDAQRCADFQQLFMPPFDFVDETSPNDEDLNQFNEQLCDDFHEIALDTLGLLCTRLENEKNFRQLVSKHQGLLKTLTTKVLKHVDSNYIRGGLVCLQFIVESSENFIEQLVNQAKVLNTIIGLLGHKKITICKHALRLLATLSQKEWSLQNDYSQINQRLQKLQTELDIKNDQKNNNEFVSWKMFDQVEKRVQISSNVSSINKLNLNVSSKS